jgi:hypothetical protein
LLFNVGGVCTFPVDLDQNTRDKRETLRGQRWAQLRASGLSWWKPVLGEIFFREMLETS